MIGRGGLLNNITPVVKNLLVINVLFFLATIVLARYDIDLNRYLGMHYFGSELFMPHQIITYMFMHGGPGHIFFNMFALVMFGINLERVWGPKRFLNFYIVTGVGAALIQVLVAFVRLNILMPPPSPEQLELINTEGVKALLTGRNFVDPYLAEINSIINTGMVGASGAIFGILLGFGMLFPNSVIYLYFAIPVKAKYFVMMYGAVELYAGIAANPGDNVAHFAHLGGMIFGYFLIRYWNKNRKTFY